ncbi:hypothetical protein RUM43_002194 [Polyplax serrata]|uniref:Uncharacterized protein n=1 Tax=Polyplax serrata TaxID=468196 RepID=A0AAN8PDH5_POLSC
MKIRGVRSSGKLVQNPITPPGKRFVANGKDNYASPRDPKLKGQTYSLSGWKENNYSEGAGGRHLELYLTGKGSSSPNRMIKKFEPFLCKSLFATCREE